MINGALITNYLSTGTIGASIGADLFGEAQINVAAVLASMGVTGCFSYVSAQAHTRTSTSISSALIDNVPPVATLVANCAVSGTVFADTNADAMRQVAEAGVGGRLVYLDVDGDNTHDAGEPSATTDADRRLRHPDERHARDLPGARRAVRGRRSARRTRAARSTRRSRSRR